MDSKEKSIVILGAGALAIALANVLADKYCVTIWTKFEEEKAMLENTRENKKLFPGVKVKPQVSITCDLTVVATSTDIINVLPFIAVEEVFNELKGKYSSQLIISFTKGISEYKYLVATEIIQEILHSDNVVAVSGPSFAIDIANEKEVHLMVGSKNEQALRDTKILFENTCNILHSTCDIDGIQLAGAYKNAVAIEVGRLDGAGVAPSTKAAYITEALNNLSNLLEKMNCDKNTAFTYAGIGDLLLTCTCEHSRNYTFGRLLGEGNSVQEAFEKMGSKTVEGYRTIEIFHKLQQKLLHIKNI